MKNPLGRKLTANPQAELFDDEPDWRADWWGMPEFEMGDARPQYRVTLNFMTSADLADFSRVTGLRLTTRTNSAWWPEQKRLNGEYYYDGPKTDSRYPVCLPSKGRADCQKTGNALESLGVTHRFFVEETEYDEYVKHLGAARVVRMPFHDLGQGSVPARNFIWDWAKDQGHKRHWTVDDNISAFTRCNANRRLVVRGGGFFSAMEDFVDRYENVAMAGPHCQGFVTDRSPNLTPVLLNSRIYSCILLDTTLPHRWRGRYNEDTDLSLRLLKDGYCTALFRALLMDKGSTHSGLGPVPKSLRGGNSDHVYNSDDRRLAFAESLRDQHPDVVSVVWRYNRWHHHVDYSSFAENRPALRDGVVPIPDSHDYGMRLTRDEK